MEYEFLFVVDGVSFDDQELTAKIVERFDAQLSVSSGTYRLAVTGEGASALEAMQSLLPQLSALAPALKLLRLDPDLVGISDIAERVGRSRQNVQQWVDGDRNSARPFPPAEGMVGRSLAWRWADVDSWLEHVNLSDGRLRVASRHEALLIDLSLMQWQQSVEQGIPLLRFTALADDRAEDRQNVMARLNQAIHDPKFFAGLLAWPQRNRHQVTVVSAVLLDPLKFVVEQMGMETSGFLAVLGNDDELHCIPIASREFPGTVPVANLGLSENATVGDLLLQLRNGAVGSGRALALT